MSDSKLIDLNAASTLSGNEVVYGVQSGNDVKITTASIAALGGGSSGVSSFNSRSGSVTPQSGDYTTAMVADSTNKRYVTDAELTVLGNTSGTNTGDQTSVSGNAGTATKLATGRTIAITGDLAYTSPVFDGSANITGVATLATVNGNTGTFNNVTVNGKGLVTAASNVTYQAPITLTTTGSSGAATFTGNTLNIPNYAGGSGGSPGGSDTNVQFNNAGSFGGSSSFTWDDTNLALNITDSVGKGAISIATGLGTGEAALAVSGGLAPGGVVYVDDGTNFSFMSGTGVTSLSHITKGSSSGNVSIKSLTGTYNFNLPTTAGASGNILASGGGSGAMSWLTQVPESSGGTNQTTYTKGNILYSSATNVLAKLAIGTQGQVLQTTSGGIPGWVASPIVLATVTGINAKTVANTTLLTVPTGRTAVITAIVVRCTAASAITSGPAAGVGYPAGTNNIFASATMSALTGTTNIFTFSQVGASVSAAAASVIAFNLGTVATGTSQTIAVDLIGYLL